MRNLLFTILLALSPFVGNSQTFVIADEPEDLQFVTLLYGHHLYFEDFNNNFNSLDTYEAFQPIQSVGISMSAFDPTPDNHRVGNQISYMQIIPQTITINDSLNGKINGFTFSMTLFQYNLTPKSKWSNIGLGLGFNTGRLRVKADGFRSRKNPFWAPALFFNPHFFIGKFVIGLNTSYQFDITRRRWQPLRFSNKAMDFDLNEFRQSGLVANASIGFRL